MSDRLGIDALWLANEPPSLKRLPREWADSLVMRTCVRTLAIGVGPADFARARFSGIDAYRYLLEILCGLRSRVPGETNIVGQFKLALQRYAEADSTRPHSRLSHIARHALRESNTIRRAYLHNIGGASYGSLVRKLLRPAASENVLIAGFGNLGQSVLPYFTAQPLAIWNRSAVAVQVPDVRRYDAIERDSAAGWADHIVLTTPPDAQNDAAWQAAVRANGARSVTHLGHRQLDPNGWNGAQHVYSLDDVFTLRTAMTSLRTRKILQARTACFTAARSLGTSTPEALASPPAALTA